MKTQQQLLDTPKIEGKIDNITLLEIEQYNKAQSIELMLKTKEVLKTFKNKFIGKALNDKLATLQGEGEFKNYVYARCEYNSAILYLSANGVRAGNYYNDDNTSGQAVYNGYREDERIYASISTNGEVKTTEEIIQEWIKGIDSRIKGLEMTISELDDCVVNYNQFCEEKKQLLKEIATKQSQISNFGSYFNELTKYL